MKNLVTEYNKYLIDENNTFLLNLHLADETYFDLSDSALETFWQNFIDKGMNYQSLRALFVIARKGNTFSIPKKILETQIKVEKLKSLQFKGLLSILGETTTVAEIMLEYALNITLIHNSEIAIPNTSLSWKEVVIESIFNTYAGADEIKKVLKDTKIAANTLKFLIENYNDENFRKIASILKNFENLTIHCLWIAYRYRSHDFVDKLFEENIISLDTKLEEKHNSNIIDTIYLDPSVFGDFRSALRDFLGRSQYRGFIPYLKLLAKKSKEFDDEVKSVLYFACKSGSSRVDALHYILENFDITKDDIYNKYEGSESSEKKDYIISAIIGAASFDTQHQAETRGISIMELLIQKGFITDPFEKVIYEDQEFTIFALCKKFCEDTFLHGHQNNMFSLDILHSKFEDKIRPLPAPLVSASGENLEEMDFDEERENLLDLTLKMRQHSNKEFLAYVERNKEEIQEMNSRDELEDFWNALLESEHVIHSLYITVHMIEKGIFPNSNILSKQVGDTHFAELLLFYIVDQNTSTNIASNNKEYKTVFDAVIKHIFATVPEEKLKALLNHKKKFEEVQIRDFTAQKISNPLVKNLLREMVKNDRNGDNSEKVSKLLEHCKEFTLYFLDLAVKHKKNNLIYKVLGRNAQDEIDTIHMDHETIQMEFKGRSFEGYLHNRGKKYKNLAPFLRYYTYYNLSSKVSFDARIDLWKPVLMNQDIEGLFYLINRNQPTPEDLNSGIKISGIKKTLNDFIVDSIIHGLSDKGTNSIRWIELIYQKVNARHPEIFTQVLKKAIEIEDEAALLAMLQPHHFVLTRELLETEVEVTKGKKKQTMQVGQKLASFILENAAKFETSVLDTRLKVINTDIDLDPSLLAIEKILSKDGLVGYAKRLVRREEEYGEFEFVDRNEFEHTFKLIFDMICISQERGYGFFKRSFIQLLDTMSALQMEEPHKTQLIQWMKDTNIGEDSIYNTAKKDQSIANALCIYAISIGDQRFLNELIEDEIAPSNWYFDLATRSGMSFYDFALPKIESRALSIKINNDENLEDNLQVRKLQGIIDDLKKIGCTSSWPVRVGYVMAVDAVVIAAVAVAVVAASLTWPVALAVGITALTVSTTAAFVTSYSVSAEDDRVLGFVSDILKWCNRTRNDNNIQPARFR